MPVNIDFLRKHTVEMTFLMKHIMLDPRKNFDDLGFPMRMPYIELSKWYYNLLTTENISEETEKEFEKAKRRLVETLLEADHESCDIPDRHETLRLELRVEMRKYWKELDDVMRDEYDESPKGKALKDILKDDNIVDNIEELFEDE